MYMNFLKSSKYFNKKKIIITQIKYNFFSKAEGRVQKKIAPVNPEIGYYEINTPIKFKENKFLIAKSDEKSLINFMTYGILSPLIIISGYKTISCVFQLKLLGGVIWGSIFGLCIRLLMGVSHNKRYIITEINLFQDGENLEIVTYIDRFKVDIANIRRINQEELLLM